MRSCKVCVRKSFFTRSRPSRYNYLANRMKECHILWRVRSRGVIWGGWGAVAPQPSRKKKERKKERKKEKEKREKKKERKKGTMNNVKLLHMKCYFFQLLNSPVALKNLKKFCPPLQEKVELTPLVRSNDLSQSVLQREVVIEPNVQL